MSDEMPVTTANNLVEEYHHIIARRIIFLILAVGGIGLFVGLLSITNYPDMTIAQAYDIIFRHITGQQDTFTKYEFWADRYIWNTAIPHALMAIIAGASLAVCGTLMQALMGNPLADPYSTGISSGACFGAVAAIVAGTFFSYVSGQSGLIINAFLGAMIPAVIIIVIAGRIRMTPATLILLGTALSYFFNSMITYMMVTTDADTLKSAYLWQVGNLTNVTWSTIPIVAVISVIGSIIIIRMSNKLNIMANGDHTAISLGIDIQKMRMMCLLLMAVMTAAIVAYTGIIGFVGLVAPHLVRLAIGGDNKFVVPYSMVGGAFLLLLADYIAFQLSNIPIGVVTCVIGSPIFFILIVWQSRRKGAIY